MFDDIPGLADAIYCSREKKNQRVVISSVSARVGLVLGDGLPASKFFSCDCGGKSFRCVAVN